MLFAVTSTRRQQCVCEETLDHVPTWILNSKFSENHGKRGCHVFDPIRACRVLPECVSSPPAFAGLPDRIRVTLCVFMCTLLIVNPFNMLIRNSLSSSGSDDGLKSHGGPARTLQSQDSAGKCGRILVFIVFLSQFLLYYCLSNAKKILTFSPCISLYNWRRPLGDSRITWLKTLSAVPEIQEPLPEWSNWCGSESTTLERIYVWHYALFEVDARIEEDVQEQHVTTGYRSFERQEIMYAIDTLRICAFSTNTDR